MLSCHLRLEQSLPVSQSLSQRSDVVDTEECTKGARLCDSVSEQRLL